MRPIIVERYNISYGRQLKVKDSPHRTEETIGNAADCAEFQADNIGGLTDIPACVTGDNLEFEAVNVGANQDILNI